MKHSIQIGVVLLALGLSVSAQQLSSRKSAGHAGASQSAVLLHPGSKVVAKVNGVALTDRDLLREMYAMFPYAQQHGGGFPKAMEAGIRQGALKMIEFEELVYQEALRKKMSISPAQLNKAEQQFRSQFHSPEEYDEFMKTEFKGSRALLRQKIRHSLLIDACLKAEVGSKAKVSVAEAKAYYEKNSTRFDHPEAFSFQSISIFPPQKITEQSRHETRKRAEEALRQAKAARNYEEFGMLAEKISDDDYRVVMGDHKAVDRVALPPEVVKAALAMQPGQISNLIQLGDAYTLFRLNAHTPAGKASFASVEKQLILDLQKDKYNRLRSALDNRLRKNAKVEEL